MDADEIRALLGEPIFERVKKYRRRIQQSTCTVNADGVRHISAMVQGLSLIHISEPTRPY